MIGMGIENESRKEDLDLSTVCHNDQDNSGTVKREEARLGQWLYYTKNLLPRNQERVYKCREGMGED